MNVMDSVLRGMTDLSGQKTKDAAENASLIDVIRFLLGIPSARKKGAVPVSEEELQETEGSSYESHSKDVNMPEGIEYIPTPAYNSGINSVIRLLNARSKGVGQKRRT